MAGVFIVVAEFENSVMTQVGLFTPVIRISETET